MVEETKMIAANCSQVRGNLKNYFDKTTDDYETIVVARKKGKIVARLAK